jgi:anti-sigma B factor antagonist
VKPGGHEFEASRSGDRVVATLSGDLDMFATFRLEPELERATRQPGVRALVIDMAGVEFIDSAGLGLLLATHERLRAEQVRFELANPSRSVRRMLDLTGAADTLAVSAAPET